MKCEIVLQAVKWQNVQNEQKFMNKAAINKPVIWLAAGAPFSAAFKDK